MAASARIPEVIPACHPNGHRERTGFRDRRLDADLGIRWDLPVEPGMNQEKAAVLNYQFRLEYDRNLVLGDFRVTE